MNHQSQQTQPIGAARVSNVTNSSDPDSVNSRVFVGNLNTLAVGKEDVERLFQRYGQVAAISMHKGYAFVQFASTHDARNSVVGLDGRIIANQILDVNMVAEPKPHQIGRKRQCLLTAATDWDLYYEGYPLPRIVPPIKRSRIDLLTTLRVQRPKFKGTKVTKHQHPHNINPQQLQDCQDILICGSCKEIFKDIIKMIDHKKTSCQLKIACKCKADEEQNNLNNLEINGSTEKTAQEPIYTCSTCKDKFASAFDVIEHAHDKHDMKIIDIPEEIEGKPFDICTEKCDEITHDNEDDAKSSPTSSMLNGMNGHEDSVQETPEDGMKEDSENQILDMEVKSSHSECLDETNVGDDGVINGELK